MAEHTTTPADITSSTSGIATTTATTAATAATVPAPAPYAAPERPINVAILGAGRIAQKMATTLTLMAQDPTYRAYAKPYAVASRDQARADEFAAQYGIPVAYGSYAQMLDDPEVDLVYIATPHSLHAGQAIACMEAGKHVLVEKAFTVNAEQAQHVIDVSRQTGRLCAEAIWTRYMPSRAMIRRLIEDGTIGDVCAISANLSYPTTHKQRIVDPKLAGGALLDVGVYPLNFIDMAIGGDGGGRSIARMETAMIPYKTGVDAQSTTTLFYDDGVMAVSTCSLLAVSDRDGAIWGTDGYLMCRNVNNVERIDVYDKDHALTRSIPVPAQLTGYEYEVAACASAIAAGSPECPDMPHADTLRMMRLLDQIRERWGLRYPCE
ncbi:Gfo/Idh/MocA family oxidoreductase [Bifidobacterium thermacidophilum]|uniref:Gfo/Idh/MocA family oxidoreductase n=1 Tax=Bifidobacterium thermacidophilum TaxID=246618 RepID=A0ABW8KNR5_9BIFI